MQINKDKEWQKYNKSLFIAFYQRSNKRLGTGAWLYRMFILVTGILDLIFFLNVICQHCRTKEIELIKTDSLQVKILKDIKHLGSIFKISKQNMNKYSMYPFPYKISHQSWSVMYFIIECTTMQESTLVYYLVLVRVVNKGQ